MEVGERGKRSDRRGKKEKKGRQTSGMSLLAGFFSSSFALFPSTSKGVILPSFSLLVIYYITSCFSILIIDNNSNNSSCNCITNQFLDITTAINNHNVTINSSCNRNWYD
jgi:hypothetical protein